MYTLTKYQNITCGFPSSSQTKLPDLLKEKKMYLLMYAPILSLILFSIAPIIGALSGYNKAKQLKAKGDARENESFLQIGKGIGVGLLTHLTQQVERD